MRWIRWTVILTLFAAVVAFLHYSLPQRDIVRIVGTEIKRMDIGDSTWFWAEPDAGSNPNVTRDVRFINAVFPSGKAYSYRNEDTSWTWPPYFKFDSGTTTAEAQDLVSNAANPRWVVVRHYGWRSELFTLFPNVLSIRPATGPDEVLIPWFNIVVIGLLAMLCVWLLRLLARLKEAAIDPVMDRMEDTVASVSEGLHGATNATQTQGKTLLNRIGRWTDTWRPKDKRRH